MGHVPRGMDFYAVTKGQGKYFNPTFNLLDGSRKATQGYYADRYTDVAIEWLKGRDRKRPFCLNLHFKGPHHPYDYPPRHKPLHAGVDVVEPFNLHENLQRTSPLLKSPSWSQLFSKTAQRPYYQRHLAEYDRKSDDPRQRRSIAYQHMIHKYLRCVAAIDENLKRVLDYLTAEGILD